MKLVEDGRNGLTERAKPAIPENLVQDVRKRFQAWQNNGDELLLEKLADWRQEQNNLWRFMMRDDKHM